MITGGYETAERTGTARFTYDAPGNYALSDNDDARWLVGDLLPAAPPARDDLQQVRQRRLAAVPADELPLGDDVLDLVGLDEPSAPEEPAAGPSGSAGPPAPPQDEPIRATGSDVATDQAGEDAESSEGAEAPGEPARHRRAVQKKRGRASVPSWDEIMFGSSD